MDKLQDISPVAASGTVPSEELLPLVYDELRHLAEIREICAQAAARMSYHQIEQADRFAALATSMAGVDTADLDKISFAVLPAASQTFKP